MGLCIMKDWSVAMPQCKRVQNRPRRPILGLSIGIEGRRSSKKRVGDFHCYLVAKL
uniref:Uncharacterized protein n=1 Tax=Rhizophora mucronata TaxID=61149 RepID=A0A2P2JD36_RHIMU